ncbi:MAG: glycosyltransferase, partial [Anaerolineaceae bacterium]|nr:glycosyltransferase [Anaerolineaceae bacterium]
MPRVCHITSSHPVDDARIFDRELLSLRKRYDDVHFVGCTDVPEQEKGGITIHGIGKRVEPLQRFGQLKRLFEVALSLKADIYHCHEPDALWVALRLKKRLDVPVIYDAHELNHVTYAYVRPGLAGRLVGEFVRVVTARLAPRCDWLITVSPGLGRYYGPLVDGRMTLIYNGSPMENFSAWESKPDDAQMVIYHEGTLQKTRDLEGILTALKGLRRDLPVRLKCLGGVSGRDRDLYDRTVAELDLEPEAVDLVPFMPYADVCGV